MEISREDLEGLFEFKTATIKPPSKDDIYKFGPTDDTPSIYGIGKCKNTFKRRLITEKYTTPSAIKDNGIRIWYLTQALSKHRMVKVLFCDGTVEYFNSMAWKDVNGTQIQEVTSDIKPIEMFSIEPLHKVIII